VSNSLRVGSSGSFILDALVGVIKLIVAERLAKSFMSLAPCVVTVTGLGSGFGSSGAASFSLFNSSINFLSLAFSLISIYL